VEFGRRLAEKASEPVRISLEHAPPLPSLALEKVLEGGWAPVAVWSQ
jgi:hypothetical protein